MSDEKKVTDQATNSELDELLDSALKDFDKPAKPTATQKEDSSSTSAIATTKEPTTDEDEWTEDFIKQASDQFQKNLEELLENGSDSDAGESLKKMAQTVAGALSDNTGEPSKMDFQSSISQAIKCLTATSDNLQNTPSLSKADLQTMFTPTTSEEGGPEFLQFIQGMMQTLLSKELLYPTLESMVGKYPAWLDEKKTTLPSTDLARYEKQFDLMQKICRELETEKEDDSEEVKKKRFEKTLSLMQEMQACGVPPDELYGDELPVFQFDPAGNPFGPPPLPGMKESKNCAVM